MKVKRSRIASLEARLALLEESQEIAHLGSWCAEVGPESLIQLTNESYRILGFEEGKPLRNIDFFNVVHPDDRQRFVETIMKVRTDSLRSEVEVRLVRSDGTEHLALFTAVARSKDGEKATVVGTIQDVTSRLARNDPEAERKAALERNLRRAIDDDQLFLEFQPVMSLDKREYIGVEALVRWQHPEHGVLQPKEFIPLAEETGLIVALGSSVISSACRELRRWLDAGVREDLTMAINVSPAQLRIEGFPIVLARAIDEASVVPSSVLLEVTESMLVEGAVDEGVLHQIRELGVRIAIDDFGTKYSSLNYLTRLPINALKVDESFVRAIDDAAGKAIVTAIAALGKALGLEVTAEGIETESQLDAVREIGCDAAQGFLISPPLSGEKVACDPHFRAR